MGQQLPQKWGTSELLIWGLSVALMAETVEKWEVSDLSSPLPPILV